MVWIYQGKEFTSEDIHDNVGFVYLIIDKISGMKYIGKKQFYTTKVRQKNKKKRRYKVESDWKDYFGSNSLLQEEVEKKGEDQFERKILHLCKSKGECSYLEAKEQFLSDALLSDEYYNSWIMCKVRRSHISKLIESYNNSNSKENT